MNLTIEQMREIVDGAPELSPIYDLEQKKYIDREDVSIAMGFLKERFLWISNLKAKIDQHYYGQSEEKELEQYAVLSQEKIEGGAVLIGSFKGFNQWMVDQGFNAIRHANCCRIAYEGGQQSTQAEIDELKTQLNNMEQCYIQLKQEHNELIAFNTEIDRKQKSAEKTAEKYKFKVSMIGDLLRDSTDQDMTLKAIQTVIDRVGEHE
ncbi:MAG: hypothetical protein L0G58_11120 [Acinetobacter sp.]|nr:hypothetical protein [Acinetobacter sp.]MDN5557144.1 hypothetical protein [Acinetobacter sp.]